MIDTETIREQRAGDIVIRHLRYRGGNGGVVPAELFQPATLDGPRPAVIVQHGANTSKADYYIQAPARRWAKEGWSVLAIDLPEHGERATAEPADVTVRRRLAGDPTFVAQALADLGAGLALLGAVDGVDPGRIAFVGFSLGGMLGTLFAAREPRVAAAAIVIAGSFAHLRYWERGKTAEDRARRRAVAEEIDPAFAVAAIAPRPLLMVNTESDPIFPREAVLSLFEAAREPKALRWHPGTHHEWGGGVYKDVWDFLRRHLDGAQ